MWERVYAQKVGRAFRFFRFRTGLPYHMKRSDLTCGCRRHFRSHPNTKTPYTQPCCWLFTAFVAVVIYVCNTFIFSARIYRGDRRIAESSEVSTTGVLTRQAHTTTALATSKGSHEKWLCRSSSINSHKRWSHPKCSTDGGHGEIYGNRFSTAVVPRTLQRKSVVS